MAPLQLKKYTYSRFTVCIGTLLTSVLFPAVSFAAYAESSSGSNQLEEVIVSGRYTIDDRIDTATGLGLTLKETPQSVSVLTSSQIKDQNLDSLTDVVKFATGISAKSLDSSRYSFSGRGFDIDNYQIDGVPISWIGGGEAGESQSDTSLYERIEIVRGATGLLTGAGNPSASINLVRKHAIYKEFTGTSTASVGSWNTYSVATDLAGSIEQGGRVRGRLVAKYKTSESYRDLAENKKALFYSTIDADLTDNTLFRIGASYQKNSPTASTWGGLPTWFNDGTRTNWNRSKTVGADWTAWGSTVKNYYAELIHDLNDSWQTKVSINRNVNSADLNLVYLYGEVNKSTGEGLKAYLYRADTERVQTSFSFELTGQFAAFNQTHDVTIGAIKSKEDSLSTVYQPIKTQPVGNFYQWDGSYPQPKWGAGSQNVNLKTNQKGVYAATRINFSDQLKVILGGRSSDWERKGNDYGDATKYSAKGEFIPYAGIVFDVLPEHSIYLSYTEIFQPQNERNKNYRLLDPVNGEAKEIGIKSSFLNESIQTSIAYFDILQDNLAIKDPTVKGELFFNGQPFTPSIGAKGARSKGYEMEVIGELMDNWNVTLSYTSFEVKNAKGKPIQTDHPDKMLKLFTSYRLSGQLQGLQIGGGINWQTDNYTETANPVSKKPERLSQDAYSLVSVMAKYDINPDIDVQLNIDNVTDKTYYSQIGFYSQYEYGEPRKTTLTLNYRF